MRSNPLREALVLQVIGDGDPLPLSPWPQQPGLQVSQLRERLRQGLQAERKPAATTPPHMRQAQESKHTHAVLPLSPVAASDAVVSSPFLAREAFKSATVQSSSQSSRSNFSAVHVSMAAAPARYSLRGVGRVLLNGLALSSYDSYADSPVTVIESEHSAARVAEVDPSPSGRRASAVGKKLDKTRLKRSESEMVHQPMFVSEDSTLEQSLDRNPMIGAPVGGFVRKRVSVDGNPTELSPYRVREMSMPRTRPAVYSSPRMNGPMTVRVDSDTSFPSPAASSASTSITVRKLQRSQLKPASDTVPKPALSGALPKSTVSGSNPLLARIIAGRTDQQHANVIV